MMFLRFGGYFFFNRNIIELVLTNISCNFLYYIEECYLQLGQYRIMLYIKRVAFDLGLSSIVNLEANMDCLKGHIVRIVVP